MKKFLTALVASLFLTGAALAAPPITLSWNAPDTYEDGLTLDPVDIDFYQFDETLDGVLLQQFTVTVAVGEEVAQVPVKYRGIHCFVGYTVMKDGAKSGPSNEACKEVTSGNPNPPKNVGAN